MIVKTQTSTEFIELDPEGDLDHDASSSPLTSRQSSTIISIRPSQSEIDTPTSSNIESLKIAGHSQHHAECRLCIRLFPDNDEFEEHTLVGV